ncbi:hypothetical protein PGT21_011796 [Puccinia graminis f. sp. tritici]|uniref:Uncharacterized protein n=1 Tax=Puccinia graminis f. sp. tritici TaxID=56615 RepID=A0A5B0Q2N8_PUCGR|nr:hypothetical protein PGT21_011796 [Puccinia graminis f. sp. tritici]
MTPVNSGHRARGNRLQRILISPHEPKLRATQQLPNWSWKSALQTEKLIAVMRFTLWWLYSRLETAQLSRSAVALQPNDLPKFASEFSSSALARCHLIRNLDKKINPSIFALVSSCSTAMARLVLNASGAFDDMRNLPGLAQPVILMDEQRACSYESSQIHTNPQSRAPQKKDHGPI